MSSGMIVKHAAYEKVKNAFINSKMETERKTTLGRCEKCRAWFPKHRLTIHHKRGRIGALLADTRHWALLCRGCHIWVTDNPAQARSEGLLCEAGQWNTVDRSEPSTPNGS